MNVTTKQYLSMLLAVGVGSGALCVVHPVAQAGSVTVKGEESNLTIGGQFRPRYQSFPAPNRENLYFFGNYRARLDFDFTFDNQLRVFLQPQKVGTFGDEESGATVTFGRNFENATNFHQAHFDWMPTRKFDLRVGRFEEKLADERLVGNFDWSQRARSFDGVRVRWGDDRRERISLYALKVAGERSPLTGGGPLPAGDTNPDQDVYILHYMNRYWLPGHRIELTYLYDDDLQNVLFSSTGNFSYPGTKRSTYGFFVAKTDGRDSYLSSFPFFYMMHPNESGFYWRAEYYRQTGDLGPGGAGSRNPNAFAIDIDAQMYAAHIGYYFDKAPGRPFVWGGWEVLSGDNNLADFKFKAFDTLYSTNHPYYGYMDYFLLSLPADTGNRGLQDAFVTVNFHPWPKTGVNVTWHNFRLDEPRGGVSRKLGNELDLTFVWAPHSNLTWMLGYSKFFTKTGMENLNKILPGEDPAFAFIMFIARM